MTEGAGVGAGDSRRWRIWSWLVVGDRPKQGGPRLRGDEGEKGGFGGAFGELGAGRGGFSEIAGSGRLPKGGRVEEEIPASAGMTGCGMEGGSIRRDCVVRRPPFDDSPHA